MDRRRPEQRRNSEPRRCPARHAGDRSRLAFSGQPTTEISNVNAISSEFVLEAAADGSVVASLCPPHAISVNGERIAFDSMLPAGRRALGSKRAWNDVLFEHTVREHGLVFRCAVGLSEQGQGGLSVTLNLEAIHPENRRLGDLVDSLLRAVVDAVQLPTQANHANISDLVGVVCLEIADPRLDAWAFVRLDATQREAIRRSLRAPLSVFLDSIPESRARLVARWSQPEV
jgi:hypothetical protein